jgi:hypothetical protein
VSDFTLQPSHLGVFGMTGSGKTTFVNAYLLNEPAAACRFVFDDWNRMWPRLKGRPCYTQADLEASLETRWSFFQPSRLLGAGAFNDTKQAFRWWCRWVFHCAGRGPGKKMVVVPEIWRHCNDDAIPQELAALAQAGRELNVELILDTQRPEMLNASIVGALTEVVCFRLMSSDALRAMERMFADSGIVCGRQTVAALPLGSYLAWNRLSGGSLSGRMF